MTLNKLESFVITIFNHELSEKSSEKCITTARDIGGLEVKKWKAITKYESEGLINDLGIKVLDELYGWCDRESAFGCFLSHFFLWKYCVETQNRIMILEHDSVFTSKYHDEYFDGVMVIGDDLWSPDVEKDLSHYKKVNKNLFEWKCECDHYGMEEHNSDGKNMEICKLWGLKGTHGYVITPNTAEKLIWKTLNRGITPLDLFMNRDNIKISEIRPKVCYQEQNYSLIQTDKNLFLKEKKGVEVGEHLWENHYDT